jgi:hypothetical protein
MIREYTTGMTEPEPQKSAAKTEQEAMLYCPVCSTRLSPRQCKLICANCDYYLSCSDYY